MLNNLGRTTCIEIKETHVVNHKIDKIGGSNIQLSYFTFSSCEQVVAIPSSCR